MTLFPLKSFIRISDFNLSSTVKRFRSTLTFLWPIGKSSHYLFLCVKQKMWVLFLSLQEAQSVGAYNRLLFSAIFISKSFQNVLKMGQLKMNKIVWIQPSGWHPVYSIPISISYAFLTKCLLTSHQKYIKKTPHSNEFKTDCILVRNKIFTTSDHLFLLFGENSYAYFSVLLERINSN